MLMSTLDLIVAAPDQTLRDVWRRFVSKQHWARLFDGDDAGARQAG